MRKGTTVLSVLLFAIAAGARPAAAQTAEEGHDAPPAAVGLEAIGQCPGREAVMAALLPALAKDPRLTDRGAPRVTDLGESFEVAAAGQSRRYDDPARDCGERARVAAVYIALALNPPTFEPPAAPAAGIAVAPPAKAPPPAPAATSRWQRLAIAARVDGTFAGAPTSSAAIAAGAEIAAALGWRQLGVAASAGIVSATTSTFGSVPVTERRFPCSLAVTARHGLPAGLEIAGDLGVSLVPFTLAGQGLETAATSTRLDVGARLAVALAFPALAGGLAPFVDLHAELYPRPYVINVDPSGDIGTTSRLWLGLAAGVSLGSR